MKAMQIQLALIINPRKKVLIQEPKYFKNSICAYIEPNDFQTRPGSSYQIEVQSGVLKNTISVSGRAQTLKVVGELMLINVGDMVIEGRWVANHELAFIIVNVHYM
jgi:hypothetical protein